MLQTESVSIRLMDAFQLPRFRPFLKSRTSDQTTAASERSKRVCVLKNADRSSNTTQPNTRAPPHAGSRREFLKTALGTVPSIYLFCPLLVGPLIAGLAVNAEELASIDLSRAPSKAFDPTDQRLRDAAVLFQQALDASTVEEEERLWTEVIETYGSVDAEWVSDIVSRAWGNRGNARSRQGRMEQALGDYTKSIQLAPYAVDPVLNRGVALENLGRFQEASSDYRAVLRVAPDDPAAWNNLGNVMAAMGEWKDALNNYGEAVRIAPNFSFASANYALALYQMGRDREALKQFRTILRRYPEFPDIRAALAVALYKEGLVAEAETNWGRMEDQRYRNRDWVRNTRRWPPRLADALEKFLDIAS